MLVAKEKTITFNLKDWLKTYWLYIVIYVFFLYVSSTTARLGDDWEVSQWYRNGILSALAGMIRLATIVNGRVASLFFGSFFAYYDFLWRFTAPAVFTSIIYLSAKLFGYVYKPVPVGISFLMLLSVSDEIRIETYVWLIGNVGYVTVIALIFLYLNIIFNENTDQKLRFWQHEKLNYLNVTLLAFVIGLWVENVTIGFTIANLLLALLSYIKTRKISAYIRYGIAGCILSCLVIFGTPARLASAEALKVGIRQQIIQNVPGIMQMLVIDNLLIYLLFFIIFVASITVGKICLGGKIPRVVGIIFASSVAIIILTRMILKFVFEKWYLPVGNVLNFINNVFFDVNNSSSLIFCFAILLFVMLAVFLSIQKDKLLVLYCMGMVSAGIMAIAPYLGARTFVLAIFMLASITAYMGSTIEIKSIDLRKVALLALVIVNLLQMEKFFYYGEYVKHVETIRLQLIDSYRARVASGLTTGDELLVLPAYNPDAVFSTANPGPNEFHMGPFKRYYHLPVDTKVIFDDGFTVKTFTITQIAGSSYLFDVSPLYNERYTYTFFVRQNGSLIYMSPTTTDNFAYYKFPGKGTYIVSCELMLPSGYAKEVFATEPVEINGK